MMGEIMNVMNGPKAAEIMEFELLSRLVGHPQLEHATPLEASEPALTSVGYTVENIRHMFCRHGRTSKFFITEKLPGKGCGGMRTYYAHRTVLWW